MYEIGGMNFLVSMNWVTKASRAVTPTVTRSRIDFDPNQNVEKHTDTIRAVGMYTPAILFEISLESRMLIVSSENFSANRKG